MILAIETATDICSVAFEDATGMVEKRIEARGSHSEKLFGFINELMDEHDFLIDKLSAVLVSQGPGSYTGLRIAASGVKGLLFGSDVPLFGVPTLASLAGAVSPKIAENGKIHAILDARRVHVYHQAFARKGNFIRPSGDVDTIPIARFQDMVQPGDIIVGTGLERLDEATLEKAATFGNEAISAKSLIELYHRDQTKIFMQRVDPAAFDPKYYTSQV